MDRTNWRWGKSDINILMLGIVFKGTAIRIYWMLLDFLCNAIVRLAYKTDRFQQALDILNGAQLSST